MVLLFEGSMGYSDVAVTNICRRLCDVTVFWWYKLSDRILSLIVHVDEDSGLACFE